VVSTLTPRYADGKVISVYDPDDAETIENGIEATGCDTHGEAFAELARAYTGWSASDSDDESGSPDAA